MGKLGALNHVSLSTSDYEQSKKFYRFLLVDLLQYKQYHEITDWIMWVGANGSAICISPGNKTPHHKFNPGLHHLAFNAETKEQVDEIYQKIVDYQVKNVNEKSVILDKPAEHSEYGPGYYSVYFTDPDGMKLEIATTPDYQ